MDTVDITPSHAVRFSHTEREVRSRRKVIMVARKVLVTTSDLSNKELADNDHKKVRFAVGTKEFELDMSLAEAKEFDTVLAPYMRSARKAPKKSKK